MPLVQCEVIHVIKLSRAMVYIHSLRAGKQKRKLRSSEKNRDCDVTTAGDDRAEYWMRKIWIEEIYG